MSQPEIEQPLLRGSAINEEPNCQSESSSHAVDAVPSPTPNIVEGAGTSTLSFFHDYDFVDGIPRISQSVSGGRELENFQYSTNSRKMAVRDVTNARICIFDLLGGAPPDLIDLQDFPLFKFCFHCDSDSVILCVSKTGGVVKWDRKATGEWSQTVVETKLEFSNALAMDFSANGRVLAAVWEMNGLCVIAMYDVSSISKVVEVKKREVDLMGEAVNVKLSPSGRGLLVLGMHKSAVWPCYATDDSSFSVPESDGWWTHDGAIVTAVAEDSCYYDFESQMSGAMYFPRLSQGLTHVGKVDMKVDGAVIGASKERLYVHEGGHVVVWDIPSRSILGQVCCKLDTAWEQDRASSSRSLLVNDAWVFLLEDNGIISIWDACNFVKICETRSLVGESREGMGHHLELHPEGNKLIFVGNVGDEMVCHVYHVDSMIKKESKTEKEVHIEIPWSMCEHTVAFCHDGSKIGVHGHISRVFIYNLYTPTHIQLLVKGGDTQAFCFSPCGRKVATLTSKGVLAIWDIQGKSGIVVDHMTVYEDKKLALDDSRDGVRDATICFSSDSKGEEMIVVLEGGPFVFDWISLHGKLVKSVEIQAESLIGQRFSANGGQCVIALRRVGKFQTELWDMVKRERLSVLDFDLPNNLVERINEQQLSLDGSSVLIGIKENLEPWVVGAKQAWEGTVFKDSQTCNFHDYGKCNILGNLGALSEDGKYVAICANTGANSQRVSIGKVDQGASNATDRFKIIDFRCDVPPDALFWPHNGNYMAHMQWKEIRVWSIIDDDKSIPTYELLKLQGVSHNRELFMELLAKYGKNLLMFPNGDGWTLLARAIEDGNTELVRLSIEWAKMHKECMAMKASNLGRTGEKGWTNLLQLALERHLPECIQVLLNGTLDGILVTEKKDEILGDFLVNAFKVYPRLVVDTLHDPRLLHQNGEIWYSQHAFEVKPFVVCTSDQLSPSNLEEMWSEPTTSLITPTVWGGIKKLGFGCNKEIAWDDGKMIPAKSYVIPISNFGKVGCDGLLSKALGMGMGGKVFDALPMKALVDYKMNAYCRELVYDDLCYFVVLLCCFSVYSLLIGLGCRDADGSNVGFHIASSLFLVLSMVMSTLGLYGELKQLVAYWRGKGDFWFYWINSKWNALEFLTYILVVVVIPIFHFGIGPCKFARGISWAVPLVDVLLWWKILYFAQAFYSTGPMVLMIFAIIKDIFFFLLIGFGVLLGFGMGFFVLFRIDEEEAFDTVGKAMLATFGMMLGDFDLELLHKSHAPTMAILLFIGYMLTMPIVLLNLLIAIMGDSFGRIKQLEEPHFVMVRASIVDDMEALLSRAQKQKVEEGIQQYLHILLPRDNIKDVGEWSERMLELKSHFEETIGKLEAKQDERIGALEDTLKEVLSEVKRMTSEKDSSKGRKWISFFD